MSRESLRRVRQMRKANPWLPIVVAVMQARWEESPNLGGYDFLADFDQDKEVTGTVGPFTVRVCAKIDHSFELGEDDVTGTFTETYEPGCIVNDQGDRECKWYRPSNLTLSELYNELRTRMGRAVARQEYARIVRQEMIDDRTRYALGVIVTVSLDDDELSSESLWGIDQIESTDGRPYLIDTARDLIDEAIDQAGEKLPAAIERARGHVAALEAAGSTLQGDGPTFLEPGD